MPGLCNAEPSLQHLLGLLDVIDRPGDFRELARLVFDEHAHQLAFLKADVRVLQGRACGLDIVGDDADDPLAAKAHASNRFDVHILASQGTRHAGDLSGAMRYMNRQVSHEIPPSTECVTKEMRA